MDVSDVLRERMQEPGGLSATAAVSLLLHAGIGAALVFGPLQWMSHPLEDHRPVMTISLGGAGTGPENGGLTAISARPVQTTEPAPKPEALRAPAAKTPEMTVPLAKTPPAKPVKAPPKATETIAKTPDARGTTLSRGKELETGSAIAVTGAKGQGFGLSTGGGKGLGAQLEVGDFCCADYLALMQQKIMGNWNQRTEVSGTVVMKFIIQRDGTLTDISLEQGSGNLELDNNAKRALLVTRQLPPLPAAYSNPTLIMHLTFRY
jgi:periplasmic protein TonB